MATIRAAGGVLYRLHGGRPLIGLVHRARYDDWSLPKGKLEDGETRLVAGVREVHEETGSRVAVSRRMTRIGYDVNGTPKTVRFWLMRHLDGEFVASDEVDELRWLSPDDAGRLLTYDVERDVLAEALAVPFPESVVVLVRHAKAGKRGEWDGDDDLRPLDDTGIEQAGRLARFIAPFRPDRVVSARPVRCAQTVAPLAGELGLDVASEPLFSDAEHAESPRDAESALLALATPGRVSVVCSQGDAIPSLLRALTPHAGDTATKKGAAWVLSVVDGTVTSADYYPHAAR